MTDVSHDYKYDDINCNETSSRHRIIDHDFMTHFPIHMLSSTLNYGDSSILMLLNQALHMNTDIFDPDLASKVEEHHSQEISTALCPLTSTSSQCNNISMIPLDEDTFHNLQDESFMLSISSKYIPLTSDMMTHTCLYSNMDSTTFFDGGEYYAHSNIGDEEDEDEFQLLTDLKSFHHYLVNDYSTSATPSKTIITCVSSNHMHHNQDQVDQTKITFENQPVTSNHHKNDDMALHDEIEGLIASFNISTDIQSNMMHNNSIEYNFNPLRFDKHDMKKENHQHELDKSPVGLWMFETLQNYHAAIIVYSTHQRYKIYQELLSCISHHDSKVTGSSKQPRSSIKPQVAGRTLIITSKAYTEAWADVCRHDLTIKLLLYTKTLTDRRKLGIHTIARHDVVITTYDILRAKEVMIPESDDTENQTSSMNWLVPRHGNGLSYELTYLHLLHWENIIIDGTDVKNIRSNTIRGKALCHLHATHRLAIIDDPIAADDIIHTSSKTSDLSSPTQINTKRKHHKLQTCILPLSHVHAHVGDHDMDNADISCMKYVSIATPNNTHKHRTQYMSDHHDVDYHDDDGDKIKSKAHMKPMRSFQHHSRIRDIASFLNKPTHAALEAIIYDHTN